MIFEFQQEAFQNNWNDWLKGGPRSEGYTRTGEPFKTHIRLFLKDMYVDEISVDEILAKNRQETQRWHLDFLKDHSRVEDTAYWNEYLLPRMNVEEARQRVERFLKLFRTFTDHTLSIWVADLETVENPLAFRYFRFDGCHRACCAKALGIKKLLADVFQVENRAVLL